MIRLGELLKIVDEYLVISLYDDTDRLLIDTFEIPELIDEEYLDYIVTDINAHGTDGADIVVKERER